MSAEVRYRGAAAADLAERLAPSGEYGRLTREAPQELIEMLDESDTTPSAQ
jgi:hypothetical protein